MDVRLAVLLIAAAAGSGLSAEKVLLDLDLTKGAVARNDGVQVEGGRHSKGWLVTGDLDRIFIDAGRDIQSGYAEVTVLRHGPSSFERRKRNWFGLSASATMNQSPGGYARSGGEGYGFSKAEIFAASQPGTICEKKFGEAADWTMDGKTPHVVRAAVRNNVMTWTNGKGGQTSCGSQEQPVTHFRYVTVGGILDKHTGWHHGSLVGLEVLRIRIVEDTP